MLPILYTCETKLQNIVFAGMDVVGSDANKIYDDVLYDAAGRASIVEA
ncbi:MAG: hypothetical protein SOZ05_02335 [Muribaculaceae bacterium]|nr:hypothetical protein [Muribaculaceae bacterium]